MTKSDHDYTNAKGKLGAYFLLYMISSIRVMQKGKYIIFICYGKFKWSFSSCSIKRSYGRGCTVEKDLKGGNSCVFMVYWWDANIDSKRHIPV